MQSWAWGVQTMCADACRLVDVLRNNLCPPERKGTHNRAFECLEICLAKAGHRQPHTPRSRPARTIALGAPHRQHCDAKHDEAAAPEALVPDTADHGPRGFCGVHLNFEVHELLLCQAVEARVVEARVKGQALG